MPIVPLMQTYIKYLLMYNYTIEAYSNTKLVYEASTVVLDLDRKLNHNEIIHTLNDSSSFI
jgi:hypothetical protein